MPIITCLAACQSSTSYKRSPSGTIGAILYFRSDWTPCLANLERVSLLRGSLRRPLASMCKSALRPVFEQLQLRWKPPGLAWGRLIPLFLFVILLPIFVVFMAINEFFSSTTGPEVAAQSVSHPRAEESVSGQAMLQQVSERLTAEPRFRALVARLSRHERMRLATTWHAADLAVRRRLPGRLSVAARDHHGEG